MKKSLIFFIMLACLLVSPLAVAGKVPKGPVPEETIPDALDYDRRHTENYRFEISPYFGDYVGDKLGHSFTTGANLTINLTPALGLVTDLGYSHASVDSTSLLGASFTNKNMWLYNAGFRLGKPAAYRSKKGTVEVDLFSIIGGGMIRINNSNRGDGFIGGGMEIYGRHQWFAIRVEVRNYFLSINNPGGSDFESDFTAMVGPVFRLPPEL